VNVILGHRTKYIGILLTWRLVTSEAKLVMWLSMLRPEIVCSVDGTTEKTPIWIGYM
jgi:hypothetical protein